MTADVTPPAPVRRSPLETTSGDANSLVTASGIEVVELPFRAQALVRLEPVREALAAFEDRFGVLLPQQPNQVSGGTPGRLRALWLGPDEWLVVMDYATLAPRAFEVLLADTLGPFGGSVVDVSAHRTQLQLVGVRTRDVLASGTSIDLHPRAFPIGTCAQTILARIDVIIERHVDDSFRAFVRTSFAQYLVDWIRDAIGD